MAGRSVLKRDIGPGERLDFSSPDKGIFLVRITGRGFAAQGRITDLGGGFSFEGEAAPAAAPSVAAKPAAAVDGAVTCSKAGYPSQVYKVRDGSASTFDFTRLSLVPLYDASTPLEPEVVVETPTALITRLSDRARDRHAREDEFHIYDHFLGHYWMHRTAEIEIIDEVAKGGKEIKLNVRTQWRLGSTNARAFYRGIGTVAEYHSNNNMTRDPANPLLYRTTYNYNPKEKRNIQVGDRMEFEISQFLDNPPVGRANYYGTTYLYIVGQGGMVPWEPRGVFGDGTTEREDSYMLPRETWLGGRTSLAQQTSNEPLFHFIQMATNLAPQNGQKVVLGRRVDHTSFVDGSHDEPDNETFPEMSGKAGPYFVNVSCNACHTNNGRALPPAAGKPLDQYVVKVGAADGSAHPLLGSVLQPRGGGEGSVAISGWTEADGLRRPHYAFTGGPVPPQYSARVSPQLVGMGLLEAVSEASIQALADPDDADKDGISGRIHVVYGYADNYPRLGRFGWKAGKPSVATQIAGAFNSDMGVMTSIYPKPDCGTAQSGCGNEAGKEIGDEHLQHLVDYISLLGVRPQRSYADAGVVEGKAAFAAIGCTGCHAPALTTSPYHPKAELRNQVIHPFTDLLLHDMGPGLADNLGEGAATGSEWRTAPLWSIGLTAGVSGGEAYLHDGRARTLQEAIRWHGGEAQAAADRFMALPASRQEALIKFLKSL